MNEVLRLKRLRLYLVDKTLVLKDVTVVKISHGLRLIGNPLTFSITPVKGIGLCVFDEMGILGHVVRLPRSMWRMLRAKPFEKVQCTHAEDVINVQKR